VGQAQDDPLGVTFDNEFTTKYIWHGYNVYGSKGAWMPSLDFDLFGSGFSANVWMAQPIGSGNIAGAVPGNGLQEAQELNYVLAYNNTVSAGEATQMDCTSHYRYYDFYETSGLDNQEIGVSLTFPNLLNNCVSGLVPSYEFAQLWHNTGAGTFGRGSNNGGAFHVFSLDYTLDVPDCPVGALDLHADVNFNDGYEIANDLDSGVNSHDSDWSHFTLGVSSDVEIAGIAFSPYVSYQISMEDTVNDDDELWAGLTTSIRF